MVLSLLMPHFKSMSLMQPMGTLMTSQSHSRVSFPLESTSSNQMNTSRVLTLMKNTFGSFLLRRLKIWPTASHGRAKESNCLMSCRESISTLRMEPHRCLPMLSTSQVGTTETMFRQAVEEAVRIVDSSPSSPMSSTMCPKMSRVRCTRLSKWSIMTLARHSQSKLESLAILSRKSSLMDLLSSMQVWNLVHILTLVSRSVFRQPNSSREKPSLSEMPLPQHPSQLRKRKDERYQKRNQSGKERRSRKSFLLMLFQSLSHSNHPLMLFLMVKWKSV
mmetsp:Transcript_10011/g.23149  ORF Transcript_10011/g.23149 Transcript_10011/m.23149 type:complete len:276 (+) Transcript_10011:589-1416(+)